MRCRSLDLAVGGRCAGVTGAVRAAARPARGATRCADLSRAGFLLHILPSRTSAARSGQVVTASMLGLIAPGGAALGAGPILLDANAVSGGDLPAGAVEIGSFTSIAGNEIAVPPPFGLGLLRWLAIEIPNDPGVGGDESDAVTILASPDPLGGNEIAVLGGSPPTIATSAAGGAIAVLMLLALDLSHRPRRRAARRSTLAHNPSAVGRHPVATTAPRAALHTARRHPLEVRP
jgi:hypothetical protein